MAAGMTCRTNFQKYDTILGSRIKSSFAGVLVGILLFIASFPLIIWNESRSVQRIKTLEEGAVLWSPFRPTVGRKP